MRSKFTFSGEVFESWANKLVWYLFETPTVATRKCPKMNSVVESKENMETLATLLFTR